MDATDRQHIVIALCALAVALAGAFFLFSRPSDTAFYRDALQNASSTQTVTLRGITYIVADGRVLHGAAPVPESESSEPLQLAYELTVAQRAPLIALPGTDPERLDAAVARLQETAETLAQLQDETMSKTVRDDLYPLGFLRAASRAERARQTFLASGSDVDARAYEAALADAARDYLHDLDSFEQGFKKAVPADAPRYITERDTNDYARMIAIIQKTRTAMRGTSQLLAARAACFRGESRRCDTLDLRLPTVVSGEVRDVTTAELAYARRKATLPPLRELLAGTDRSNEPFMRIENAECTVDMPGTNFFILRDATDASGTPFKVAAYVGNGRLVDISGRSNVGFFKYFLDHGVRYVPSTPMVYYECLNFSRDVSRLLSMELARRTAQSSPISTAADTAHRRELSAFESALSRQSPSISEGTATGYAAASMQALRAGALSAPAARRATELALSMHDGSSLYENHILDMTEIERTNAVLYRRGIEIGLDATSLFYTRSGFPALFMAYNPSVTGITEDLFGEADVPASRQPYIYYDSLSPSQQKKADDDKAFYYSVHAFPTSAPQ